MEGLLVVRSLTQSNDYMMKLDLKDAYYTVAVHPEYRRFLRFVFNGKTFEFQCLSFGLKSAPRAFTRLMTLTITHIRSLGIRVVIYLDDLLILHQVPIVLQSIFKKVIDLFEGLGFLINLTKCSQCPSQQLIFLGTILNTVTMSLSLPTEKLDVIQTARCTPASFQGQVHNTRVSSTPWTHEPCISERHLACTSALQSATEGSLIRYPQIRLQAIEPDPRFVTMCYEGCEVVDVPGTQEDQCPTSQIPTFRFGDPHRCISAGVGSISRQHSYWGTLEPREIAPPHQCPGTQSSIPGNPGVHKESIVSARAHLPTHRQHHCGGVYQQDRGNTLPISISSSSRTLVLRSREGILGDSNTYPRYPQQQGRHSFSSFQPQGGVDVGLQCFPENRRSVLSPGCGSVCVKAVSPGQEICLQIPGPRGHSSRCMPFSKIGAVGAI